jgi:transcriptional regulator with XRE-family HTH domain
MPADDPGAAVRPLFDHKKLRAWRDEAGLTIPQVCVATGLSHSWIYGLEQGYPYRRPSLDTLTILATFYGHQPGELLMAEAPQ